MNNDELKLSQIADSIRYIPLSNDFILKDIESMKVDDEGNFYIISSDENGVYKFDRKGNFICQISKKGQGPGEYISLSDCDIHEGKISMNNGAGRMLYFDLDGKLLYEKPLDEGWTFSISSGDTIYGSSCRVFGTIVDGKETLYIFDDPGQELLSMHMTHFTRNGSRIYWEDLFNDTIYGVLDGIPTPSVYIDFGKLKLPDDIVIDNSIYENSEINHYCTNVSEFRISDAYISFYFSLAKSTYSCLYNRETQTSYTFNSISNDLDHFPLGSWITTISGKKIYSYIPSELLSGYYATMKESKKTGHQKIAKQIEVILGKVPDEMDNPILVEITCK